MKREIAFGIALAVAVLAGSKNTLWVIRDGLVAGMAAPFCVWYWSIKRLRLRSLSSLKWE